eukprot:TRINITY_DN6505_c0_g1_i2.p2 TRINITY_DN6505_c0_g1~~TRINITY_DN6505_c0_g1_i2.p2  ORF type:complete len:110 (-),score=9.34 TRINITY_DN6505_c0_g1_i2:47-376(-)
MRVKIVFMIISIMVYSIILSYHYFFFFFWCFLQIKGQRFKVDSEFQSRLSEVVVRDAKELATMVVIMFGIVVGCVLIEIIGIIGNFFFFNFPLQLEALKLIEEFDHGSD